MGDGICDEYENNVLPYLHNGIAPEYRDVVLAYAILLLLFSVFGFAAFIFTKHDVIYLRHKNTLTTFGCTIAMVCEVIVYVYREYYGRDRFPCIVLVVLFHLIMILISPQQIGTLYLYIYKLRHERMKTLNVKKMFNEDVEVQSQSSLEQTTTTLTSQAIFFRSQSYSSITAASSIVTQFIDFFFVWRHSKDGKIVIPGEDQSQFVNGRPLLSNIPSFSSKRLDQSAEISGSQGAHHMRQVCTEELGVPLLITFLFGFPYPIAVAVRIYLDPIYYAGCVGCRLTYVDFFLKICCGSMYFVMAAIGIYSMRNEYDPLRIFRELKMGLAWGFFIVVCWIVNVTFSLNGHHDNAIVNMIDMFGTCGVYYALVLSGVVTAKLQKRKWKSVRYTTISRQITPIASTRSRSEYSLTNLPPPSAVNFDLVLREPKVRNAFLEHTINEISSENLVFVFKQRAWKEIWDKEKPEKVSKIAVQLFREYISKDSKAPINISYRIYANLEKEIYPFLEKIPRRSNLQAENLSEELKRKSLARKPKKDIFDECEKECALMLEHDGLPRFIQSELFKTEVIEAGLLYKILKR